jgi:hypothetical protein
VSTFDEALARLDGSPETVRVKLGGERPSVVVDGGALVRVIRHLLSFSDAGAHGAIPSIVYAARDGHVDAVAGVLAVLSREVADTRAAGDRRLASQRRVRSMVVIAVQELTQRSCPVIVA